MQSLVASNMEYIQHVFLSTQNFMRQKHEKGELDKFLNTFRPEFRPVAFEAVAMELLIKDISTND